LSGSVALPRGCASGRSGTAAPATIEATADQTGARIAVNGRERARSDAAVMATIDDHGRTTAVALDASEALRVPLDMTPRPLFRLSGTADCRDIGNAGWQDLSSLDSNGTVTVRIDTYRAFASTTIFYVAGPAAARAQLRAVAGVGSPAISTRAFDLSSSAGRAALASAAGADQAQLPAAFFDARVVSRIEFEVDDKGAYAAAHIELGVVPSALYAHATVDLDNPKRATICAPREIAASSRD
jgi:hypothetical protein